MRCPYLRHLKCRAILISKWLLILLTMSFVIQMLLHSLLFKGITQSRIIGAVRGAHSQLWGTIIPVCSLFAARKYDRRFGTPALV